MTGKIFRSIFWIAISVLLASLVLIFGVLYSYVTKNQRAQLATDLSLAVSGVEKGGIDYLQSLDEDCRLTWIAADGSVLFDSQTPAAQMENHGQREEIRLAFAQGEGESERYSDTLTKKTVYRARRLSDGTVLRVSVAADSAFVLLLSILQPITFILLAALAVSVFLAYKLSAKITEPLEALDLEHPLEKKTYEELEPLLRRLDIQQKKIEAQRQELTDKRTRMEFAEQNRREFTANVSHELKTPLQTIMGSAELMENGMVQQEDLTRFAGNIRKDALRLLHLIDDIIHLSRLDENEKAEFSQVELSSLCREELAAMELPARQAQVELALLGEPAVIQGLPQLVREIVHNLLENAVKYNRKGGKVTVRTAINDKTAVLTVSDTGIGIAPEEQERIFERFYRVDKSRSKASGGTGLGLSIVKHAVSYLGGSIFLESEPTVGTTIRIHFPVSVRGEPPVTPAGRGALTPP